MNREKNVYRVRRQAVWEFIAPLYRANAAPVQIRVKPYLIEFAFFTETIEIHVKKWETTAKFVKNRKSRTRDVIVDTKAQCEPFDELCFSGAKITDQAQDRPGRRVSDKFRADEPCLLRVAGETMCLRPTFIARNDRTPFPRTGFCPFGQVCQSPLIARLETSSAILFPIVFSRTAAQQRAARNLRRLANHFQGWIRGAVEDSPSPLQSRGRWRSPTAEDHSRVRRSSPSSRAPEIG